MVDNDVVIYIISHISLAVFLASIWVADPMAKPWFQRGYN
jgi:hypothetical protein